MTIYQILKQEYPQLSYQLYKDRDFVRDINWRVLILWNSDKSKKLGGIRLTDEFIRFTTMETKVIMIRAFILSSLPHGSE